VLNRKVRKA